MGTLRAHCTCVDVGSADCACVGSADCACVGSADCARVLYVLCELALWVRMGAEDVQCSTISSAV